MSALGWESAFGRLLLDGGFRRWVWQAGIVALENYDLTESERTQLLALDRASVERAALGLKRKRLLRLRSAVPLVLCAFGDEQERLVDAFYTAHPTVPASCAAEVRSFGEVAARHAHALGAAWLAELVQFEVDGHLACCRDAIDAEGVVLAHLLSPTQPPAKVDEPGGFLDLRAVVARVSPLAWTVRYSHDVVAIADWLRHGQRADGGLAQPPEDVARSGDYLVARRPDRELRVPVSLTLHPPIDQFWTAVDGQTPVATLIDTIGAGDVPREAWMGMVRRLAERGLIELRPARRRFRWGWGRDRGVSRSLTGDDQPTTPTGGSTGSGLDLAFRPGDHRAFVVARAASRGGQAEAALSTGTLPSVPAWGPARTTRFGIGLRLPYARQLMAASSTLPALDCLEIYADDYLRPDTVARAQLAQLRALYPLVPHGLELSLGSVVPPPADYLGALAELIRLVGAPYYTEHLAWTQTVEWRPGHLSPLLLDAEALERVARRVVQIQDAVGVPLAVENVTYDVLLPGGGLAEADFLSALCERTGCYLLVDVTNVVVNGHNHGFDPRAYVDRLPPERVWQLHLVGYTRDPDGTVIDAHAETTQREILTVARHLLDRGARPRAVILERDQFLPSLGVLLAELEDIRRVLSARAIMDP